ncbi:MAG: globin domain-containing protein [Phycisphaerales bacterium]
MGAGQGRCGAARAAVAPDDCPAAEESQALTAERVERIRSSFAVVAPRVAELMETFNTLLFERYPQVRPLFPPDMTGQKQHLTAAVALVVKHADNLAALEPALMEMGARHVRYGARPEHYPLVGATMLDALESVAGPVWNATLRDDWDWALNAVASAMVKGAEAAEGVGRRKAA